MTATSGVPTVKKQNWRRVMIQTESSRCRNPPKVSIFKAKANLARHKKGNLFFLRKFLFQKLVMDWGGRHSHLRSHMGQQQHLPRQWSLTWGLYSSRGTRRFSYFFSAKWLMSICILSYLLFYGYPSPSLQKRVTPVTHPEAYYGVPKKGVSVLGWRNLIILCRC